MVHLVVYSSYISVCTIQSKVGFESEYSNERECQSESGPHCLGPRNSFALEVVHQYAFTGWQSELACPNFESGSVALE